MEGKEKCRYKIKTIPVEERGHKSLCIGCPHELDCKDDGVPRTMGEDGTGRDSMGIDGNLGESTPKKGQKGPADVPQCGHNGCTRPGKFDGMCGYHKSGRSAPPPMKTTPKRPRS